MFCKKISAKEAASKGLGTGFKEGVYLKDLEGINFTSGKPYMNF